MNCIRTDISHGPKVEAEHDASCRRCKSTAAEYPDFFSAPYFAHTFRIPAAEVPGCFGCPKQKVGTDTVAYALSLVPPRSHSPQGPGFTHWHMLSRFFWDGGAATPSHVDCANSWTVITSHGTVGVPHELRLSRHLEPYWSPRAGFHHFVAHLMFASLTLRFCKSPYHAALVGNSSF